MGFAGENIGIAGVAPGAPSDHMWGGFAPLAPLQPEPATLPLARQASHVIQEVKPRFQAPFSLARLARLPWMKPTESGPSVDQGDRGMATTSFLTPQPTRQRTGDNEAEQTSRKLLTGSRYGRASNDHEGRGVNVERPAEHGNFSETWDIYSADGTGPAPILHVPEGGLTDDITEQVQALNGETHETLRSLRHNFPWLQVAQFPPQTVSVALIAGQATEIVLPDGAVICRIAWSQSWANDLWVSLHGNARIPQAADLGTGNMSDVANKGMILNPDPAKYFYCKGIKTFSAISAAGVIVNACCYVNN